MRALERIREDVDTRADKQQAHVSPARTSIICLRDTYIYIYIYIPIQLIFQDGQSEVSLQLIALTPAMSLGGRVWSQSHRNYVSFKYIATRGSE